MVIIYAYLKHNNSIMSCIPFRYNGEDEKTIETREIILNVDPETTTYNALRQDLLNLLDKEKQENVKLNTELSFDMSSVITVE